MSDNQPTGDLSKEEAKELVDMIADVEREEATNHDQQSSSDNNETTAEQ